MRTALILLLLAAPLAAAPALVEIPGASYEIADALTGVKLTVAVSSFLMARAELTQREFEQAMGYNPSFHKGPDLPVENVTWWEAIRYANLRSAREGLEPVYNLRTGEGDLRRNGYRLPTDAEWTRAAGKLAPPESANLGSADTKSLPRLEERLKSAGTRPAGAYPPNQYGLYDMTGNVWEWCHDYFNPVVTPAASLDPPGPQRGLARIVRGGSFVSTTSRWSRGYRSSMEPAYKSRFTGFRICRTLKPAPAVPAFTAYGQAPAGYETATGNLPPLVPAGATLPAWEARAEAIRKKWAGLLGALEVAPPAPAVRLVETVHDPNYTARLQYLQVEPDWWEKILVMTPPGPADRPRPVVIVPYYDVDVPAGRNLSGRTFMPASVRSFAYLAVQRGCIAVAIRWFGESYGEGMAEAVANLRLRHPRATGLGKWVWDAHRLLDYIATLPEADPRRIGIIGHSLGAKMATYAAAFDSRIAAVVASEGGIGLSFSNYDDFWYLGDFIRKAGPDTDHHELLGLIAPRSFLLIGGDDSDNIRSWHYINAARPIYALYGKPQQIGYFNHHQGHSPTPESVQRAMDWLAYFLR